MKSVSVSLKKSVDDSYEVALERGLLKRIASDLRMKRFAEQYVLITDSKVNRLYASAVTDALKREKLFLGKIVVPAGEKSKSVQEFQKVQEKMVALGANRQTGVVALGGGVVGDLAGFVAASFMRGVPYVQVPTTLLAMVDSSVGGKVGIDLDSGKNLVGAFWQPKKVYVDADVLETLTQKQFKAGLGEAIKYGAIRDRELWEFFEQHLQVWNKKPSDLLPGDKKVLEDMIERCVQIKADVVMKDEKEGNLRQILNYGHTFGHVIELMSDYKVLHGEAVATGMRMAAALAVELRLMRPEEHDRQAALFDELGIGKAKTKGLVKDFVKHMRKDKKAKNQQLVVVLVDRLGRCYQRLGKYGVEVDESTLTMVLEKIGLIDNKKKVAKVTVSSSVTTLSASSTSPSTGSCTSPSFSSPSVSSGMSSSSAASSVPEETDLQRRLREMRERAQARRQQGGGGFLPG